MTKVLFYYFVLILNLGVIGCSDDASESNTVIDSTETDAEDEQTITDEEDESLQNTIFRILPVGDSRVQGDRPDDESYRYELWKLLIEKGISFDLVGTKKDEAEYPTYLGFSFDRDHEGTGGATTIDLLQEVNLILDTVDADFVLLGIGGNDLYRGNTVDETLANIELIVDKFQSNNTGITILIEQIAPAVSSDMTAERWEILEEFHTAISELARERTTGTSLMIPIDMYSNWKDEYLADDVHYNEMGAKEVAQRYFNTLDTLLVE